MDEQIFQDCYQKWKIGDGYSKFWPTLAEKWGYKDGESLRYAFKRERKKRGISKVDKNDGPKILIFDIECSPISCWSFGTWNVNINIDQIVQPSYLLSWSAKYLNDPKVYSDVLTKEEAVSQDDFRILQSMWDMLNSADVLIGHNIIGFDLKKLNTRFIYHNLPPIKKHLIIDTLLVCRSNFYFESNKLAYINRYLGIKQKQENSGFSLWKDCVNGDEESLRIMDEYCKHDTLATEDLYYRIRPFVKSHPNLGLFSEANSNVCPNCGSSNLKSNGFYYTQSGKYESVRCDCGAVSRKKVNLLDKDKKKSLLI